MTRGKVRSSENFSFEGVWLVNVDLIEMIWYTAYLNKISDSSVINHKIHNYNALKSRQTDSAHTWTN